MKLIRELKRRNIFRVATLYLVAGWLVLQVADVLSGVLGLPDWTLRLITLILGLGFLFVVIFAWVYELTPEGVKKASEVDPDTSITGETGRRLNLMIVVLLALAVGLLGLQLLSPQRSGDVEAIAATPEVTAEPEMGSGSFSTGESEPDPISEPDGKPSLAVLPFVNLSSDPEQEYFSDGLAESLLHLLAQVPELQVAARTSSFRFKGQAVDIGEISAQLKVAHVLEGSVRRAGNTVRVTAQLVKADDGFHLWSGTYDRELEDVFAIQDEIAGHVAEALKVALLGETEAPIAARDTDLEAYEAYLRGRQQLAISSYTSLPLAEAYFERALEIDPDYLDALVSLAETLTRSANTGIFGFRELATRLEPLIEHFERIAPDSPHALVLRGYQEMPGKGPGHPDVMPRFRRAWEMAPDDTFIAYHYATMLSWSEQPRAAIEIATRALETNPLSDELNMRLGFAHFFLREYEEAIQYGRQLQALEPDRPTGFQIEGDARSERGEFAAALESYRGSKARDPNDAEADASIAMLMLAMRAPDQAEAALAALAAEQASTVIPLLARGSLYASRGERESLRAHLEELARTRPEPRSWGIVVYSMMLVDLYASGMPVDDAALLWNLDGDLDSPEIQGDTQYWYKLARVPALRESGRADDADAILAAARNYAEGMSPLDVPMFGIHYAEQNTAAIEDLMAEDLADGPGLFWWLFYENAVLDFARDSARFQSLLTDFRAHADAQRALMAAGH